ncbi:HemK/PrmC family methyltransferase [Halobacteriovorax sp. HLS]|uniref:N5-glutamine methyltransferase family protein n=1 Tax=Halobacteriovorax sp. HLS TaxID=2234000 RepID=UPI000FD98656|nr:HemK/PrmC family methyltransferase [Halobacteriovorax sp. HLS]
MALMSLGSFTESFFSEKQEQLLKTYPGLSIRRLKDEIESFALQKHVDADELFEHQYIPSGENPLTHFFNSLNRGYPLEYIRGRAYFYKSEFHVSPSVLIPRSETEILVETATILLNDWLKKTDESLRVLDIGTGSGAIIISLLQEIDRPLSSYATDISKEALKIARRNFFNLRFTIPRESSLDLICTDRMKDLREEKFHLIVSNPPYIKEDEDRKFVHNQVDTFEPHLALYLKDGEYYDWFEELFQDVSNSLYEEGVFIMEGHEDHLEDLRIQCEKFNFKTVSLIKDYTQRDRFLIAKK